VGRRFECDGKMGGNAGDEPASSTLKDDETGEPFHIQQAKQIRAYREAWAEAGHTHAAGFGQPQHFALMNDRPDVFRFGP
jgi:hypothetical protein